jgi:hypothetical protein
VVEFVHVRLCVQAFECHRYHSLAVRHETKRESRNLQRRDYLPDAGVVSEENRMGLIGGRCNCLSLGPRDVNCVNLTYPWASRGQLPG